MTLNHFRPERGERHDEFAARIIVETNSSWTLRVIDDGTSGDGLVDYEIVDSDKPTGVLEAGRNTDASATANAAAWQRWAAEPRVLPGLKWAWGLICDPHRAKFKQIHKQALPILRELEAASIQCADRISSDGWRSDSFGGRLMAIGVLSATAFDQNRKPGFVIATTGDSASAPLGPQAVVDELEGWLTSNDADPVGLRRKLSSTQLPNRHAFVWVDLRSPWAAWLALDKDPLPSVDPRLPSPITGVWIASGSAGWRWDADTGWSRIHHVEEAVHLALQDPA